MEGRCARFICTYPGASAGQCISIHIQKNIPMAAGLAGGSADGAAVLHALNRLFGLELSLKELMASGREARRRCSVLPYGAGGGGTRTRFSAARKPPPAPRRQAPERSCPRCPRSAHGYFCPNRRLRSRQRRSTVRFVSRRSPRRPDTDKVIESLYQCDYAKLYKNMYNILEKVSELRYPVIVYTKNMMALPDENGKVMMSGSGPTIFAVSSKKDELETALPQNEVGKL